MSGSIKKVSLLSISALSWALVIVVAVKSAEKPSVSRSALASSIMSSQFTLSTENCHW